MTLNVDKKSSNSGSDAGLACTFMGILLFYRRIPFGITTDKVVLAGGIAHEFNNILAALLGFATLLHREVQPKSRVGLYVQQVRQAGNRAKELVQQILTFSRAECLARQPLQLDQVVQEALTLLRASLPSTVDIQYHVSEPGVMVQANRTQLHEVIMNLGANADYAMRQSGGRLTVRVDLVEVDAAFRDRLSAALSRQTCLPEGGRYGQWHAPRGHEAHL